LLAGWDALVPPFGRRALGSTKQFDRQSHRAGVFCFTEDRILALHGIIKKTQATPAADLELARKRKRESV
jgi:phage-related protein